ncbi:MAG: hypothetical protein ABH856_01210 [Patescibacteria group bacterium]|nr:hypothetical protein [Patescibacteria group bacterium]
MSGDGVLFSFKKNDGGKLFNLKPAEEEAEVKAPKAGKMFSFKNAEVQPEPVNAEFQVVAAAPAKKDIRAEENAFANIFGQPVETEDRGDEILDSVVKAGEDSEQRPLLGPLPKIDTSLFIDEEYHAKKKLAFARGAFAGAMMLAITVFGYLYMQLSPSFELISGYQNTEQSLHAMTNQLVSMQTQLNAERYKIIKAHLDTFTYYADEFLKKYAESEATKIESRKQALAAEITELRSKLEEDFKAIKEKLADPNYTTVYREEEADADTVKAEFNRELKQYFRDEKADIMEKRESSIATVKAKELNEIIALIGNEEFESIFGEYDLGLETNESIKSVISKINGVTKNELSILHTIRQGKINWTDIIYEIEGVTKQVDSVFGSGFFEDLGGIAYTSYDFDSNSRRISITGQAKKDDAKNFSLIANLIDALEASSMFKDVNMRSFTKSGSLDDVYVATLKLDFFLQGDEKSEADEKPNPDETLEDSKGIKTL